MIVLGYGSAFLAVGYLIASTGGWWVCEGPLKNEPTRRHEYQHALQLVRAALFLAVSVAWLLGVRP